MNQISNIIYQISYILCQIWYIIYQISYIMYPIQFRIYLLSCVELIPIHTIHWRILLPINLIDISKCRNPWCLSVSVKLYLCNNIFTIFSQYVIYCLFLSHIIYQIAFIKYCLSYIIIQKKIVVTFFVISLSLKFHKDPSFHWGVIPLFVTLYDLGF